MIQPRVENLLCARWLAFMSGEHLPHDEPMVAKAMDAYSNRRDLPKAVEDTYRFVRFTDLLKTASVYVIDPLDVPPGLGFDPQDHWDLPPMPFKRVFFEFALPGKTDPVAVLDFTDLDGLRSRLACIGIVESVPSTEWRVYLGMDDKRLEMVGPLHERMALREYSLMPGPRYGTSADEIEKAGLSHEDQLRWMSMAFAIPTSLVQLVTVIGSAHLPVTIPRPHRRGFERRWGEPHPSVYTVSLGSAGDVVAPGRKTDRKLHVRFLVRGFYRRHRSGKYDVPGKGRCVFVQSHVRGPAGAPWGGRQIRVKQPEAIRLTMRPGNEVGMNLPKGDPECPSCDGEGWTEPADLPKDAVIAYLGWEPCFDCGKRAGVAEWLERHRSSIASQII